MAGNGETAVHTRETPALLHRGLGVGSIVFMVVAAVAPLGAASVVLPTVFAASGTAAAPAYFVGATVILCLFSVGYTLMSRYVENAGAFYAYVQAGLGKIPAAGTACLALASYTVLLVGLTAYLGVAASAVVETYLGLAVKWWIFSLAALALVGYLGYRDVELSAKVLGVFLVLEVLVILVVDFAITFHGGKSGLSAMPLNPAHVFDGAPGLGLMFAFFAFFGFEATAVFRSEAREPNRTVPRATYLSVLLIGVLYGFTSWAQAMGAGSSDVAATAAADPARLMTDLSVQYVGPALQHIIQILLVTSIFACVLSFHNVVTRYQFTLATTHLLPATLGRVHPKHRAPSRSSLVVSAATMATLGALAISGLDPVTQIYTWLSGSATLGIILMMVLTSISVIVFHLRGKRRDPAWNATVAPLLSLAGLGLVLYLVIDQFPQLVGGPAAALAVGIAIATCFLAGAAVVAFARIRRPEAYARMLS
ncbi:APC family permease [Amycolatopsis jejuensis]|uniref:APC family permease n=1 Tax=Amycolatopsis jejuensis TaxID=330084 RepID=UPI000A058097|nr:APC family permease [Amycolatopsis jejuensis]